MFMDWLFPERAADREETERLQRENKKLWTRIQRMEDRLDRLSIEQFICTYGDDENTMKTTSNILKRFALWVTR